MRARASPGPIRRCVWFVLPTLLMAWPVHGGSSTALLDTAGVGPGRHAVFLELLGVGGLGSVNYEVRVGPIGVRAGFTRWGEASATDAGTRVRGWPLLVTRSVPSGPGRRADYGVGVVLGRMRKTWKTHIVPYPFGQARPAAPKAAARTIVQTQAQSLYGVATVGVRFAGEGGTFCRFAATPLIGFFDWPFLPSLGISCGATW